MNDADTDRFSKIPDELIHHIYSFLDMKEVLGTTLLSKRWRYLWRSLNILNFNQYTGCSIGEEMTAEGKEKSRELVEQVLLHRDGSNIQMLCFSNHFCLRKRFLAWLDSAVKQHVQGIRLENMRVFCSFADQIKTVVLKNCTYDRGIFTISSSGLSYLNVENSGSGNTCCIIVLCAPNLTTLQLKGNMFGGYKMDNLSALVTAEIDVHITDMYSRTREACRSCFSHIFSGVRNVESLTLPTHCLKFLPGLSDDLKLLPITFNNLKHLKLTEWRERSCIGVMTKLFRCFPNVEILILERTEPYGSEKEGDWEAELSPDSIFGHLKVVEIRKFYGSKNEYKFLEFLLSNAMVLEHVTMKVTKSLSEEKANELVDFGKKLHVMLKASPSVTIRLMKKTEERYTILFEESSSLFKSPLPVLDSLSLSKRRFPVEVS